MLGKTIPQVAIRWLLQQAVVASVIIGATSLKQLEDNMGAGGGWELSKDEVNTLFYHIHITGPRRAVGNVSGNRCKSDCRSRDREFDPGSVPYFCGD